MLKERLPPQREVAGRLAKDHGLIVDAIIWRTKTGVPWRDLPARFGLRKTVTTRFQHRQRSGVWDRAPAARQQAAAARHALEWDLPFLGGTTIRAYPSATGATIPPLAAGAAH